MATACRRRGDETGFPGGGGRLRGAILRKQPHLNQAREHNEHFFPRSYPIYENEMIIPMLIELILRNLVKRPSVAVPHTKVRRHEISCDSNVANLRIKVHLEGGTRDLVSGWLGDRFLPMGTIPGLLHWCAVRHGVYSHATRGSYGTIRRGVRCGVVEGLELLGRYLDDELEVMFSFGL